jgi:hypothetical protein
LCQRIDQKQFVVPDFDEVQERGERRRKTLAEQGEPAQYAASTT